jgi:hypothetical protein
MPDPTIVATSLRNELEAAGLIRRPNAPGALPPLHVEPLAAPAPGERESPETDGELVATLRLSSEPTLGPYDAWRRVLVFDVVYRSSTTAGLIAGRALDAAVRRRLVDRDDYGFGFVLNAGGPRPVYVLSLSIYGGLGPVGVVDGIRTEVAKYALEVYAAG